MRGLLFGIRGTVRSEGRERLSQGTTAPGRPRPGHDLALDRCGIGDTWCAVFLGLTWVVVWHRQLFLSVTTFVGDTAWVFFPLRALSAARLRAGEIGLWNPHVFGGVPFAADPQSQALYPSRVLLALISVPGAMSASLALHSLLLIAGTYLLGRYSLRLRPVSASVCALAFGLCAPALGRATIPVYPEALAWLPWVMVALDWALRGGSWVRLWAPAGIVAVQLLAGAPQYTYYTLIVMVGVAAWRAIHVRDGGARLRAVGSIPIVLAAAVLLSAIQMLPMVEMVPLTQRASDLGYGFATYGSLPIESFLATLFFPRLWGTCLTQEVGGFQMHWYLGYVGVVTLGLALVAMFLSPRRRQVWWLLGLTLLSLAIAAGSYNPLFVALYRAVPGLALFRTPASIIVLTDLALALLAGLGMEAACLLEGRRRWAAAALAAVPGVVVVVGAPWAIRVAGPLLEVNFAGWPWWHVGLTATGCGAVAILLLVPPGARRGIAVAVLLCLATDLAVFSSATDIAAVIPNEVLTATSETVAFQRATRPMGRRWEMGYAVALRKCLCVAPTSEISEYLYRETVAGKLLDLLPSDLPAAYQIDGLDGAWGAMLPLRRHVASLYNREVGPKQRQWFDLLGVAYFVDTGDGRAPADCPVVCGSWCRVRLHENPNAAPRAFWSAQAELVPDCETATSLIEGEIPFRYHERVCVEGVAPATTRVRQADGPENEDRPANDHPASVSIEAKEAERWVMTVRSAADGWLVVSDNYYPGWRARVNGAEVVVLPANGVMRAVRVPAGEHRVEMRFHSESLRLGAFMSLLGLALLAGTLCARRRL